MEIEGEAAAHICSLPANFCRKHNFVIVVDTTSVFSDSHWRCDNKDQTSALPSTLMPRVLLSALCGSRIFFKPDIIFFCNTSNFANIKPRILRKRQFVLRPHFN